MGKSENVYSTPDVYKLSVNFWFFRDRTNKKFRVPVYTFSLLPLQSRPIWLLYQSRPICLQISLSRGLSTSTLVSSLFLSTSTSTLAVTSPPSSSPPPPPPWLLPPLRSTSLPLLTAPPRRSCPLPMRSPLRCRGHRLVPLPHAYAPGESGHGTTYPLAAYTPVRRTWNVQ